MSAASCIIRAWLTLVTGRLPIFNRIGLKYGELHVGTVFAVTHWPRPPLPSGEPPAAAAAKKAPPSPKVLAAWRGKVITHLNSRKREFGGADGTATVAFKIDRSGKVMSAQVLSSSGNKELDAEAVAMTQRASPVPAPPADIAGDTLYLKVPIRFKR